MKQWKQMENIFFSCVVTACSLLFMLRHVQARRILLSRITWQSMSSRRRFRYREMQQSDISMETIPEYDGEPYVVIDDNEPDFTEEELQPEAYETYGTLDELGRCGTAEASIGEELYADERSAEISGRSNRRGGIP